MTNHNQSAILSIMENKLEQPAEKEPEWLTLTADLRPAATATPLSKKQLRRWGLVLEARGLPFRNQPCGRGWLLQVAASDFERASRELRQYEELNRNWPAPLPVAGPQQENLLASLSVLLLVACFHNLSQLDINLFSHRPVDWTSLGNAHAGKILQGEWWRTLTSLTLHADWLHLFSNLTLGGLFIVRLCRDLGAGLGWSLLLASGLLGNLTNALLQPFDHRAVGASTAVFGAVGLVAAIGLIRYRHNLHRRWPLPIAAALALLALLGSSGERTDLGAHLFGFICGFGLGLAAEYTIERHGRPGVWFNRMLSLGAGGVMLLAWWAALI
jgi:membrane associated rhomboid family serine protease